MGQNQTGVAISGHSERISPGVIRSEVGRPEGLWLTTGRPTSECITPGEILSEWPEVTTPVWLWPKFLENHTPVNPQKFSRGLPPRLPTPLSLHHIDSFQSQKVNEEEGK